VIALLAPDWVANNVGLLITTVFVFLGSIATMIYQHRKTDRARRWEHEDQKHDEDLVRSNAEAKEATDNTAAAENKKQLDRIENVGDDTNETVRVIAPKVVYPKTRKGKPQA